MDLPVAVAAALRDGGLCQEASWQPLADVQSLAPVSPGLYALGLPCGIRYDGGVSRIAYIGAASKLRNRLMQHLVQSHNWHIHELRRAFGELWVTWWPLPKMDQLWLLTIEGEAICAFERQFGSIPVCNLSVPMSPHAKSIRGRVQIGACDTKSPEPLDALATTLNQFRVRPRFRPGLGGKSITANEWFYDFVLPTPEERANHKRAGEIELLSSVRDEMLAAWSFEKMQQVVAICKTLVQAKTTTSSKVSRFQAAARETPSPHTWGEVALIQGRVVAGTWYPQNKVWVKVLFGKELLGQAFLEDYIFRGEDMSDLPQRTSYREIAPATTEEMLAAIEGMWQRAQSDSPTTAVRQPH